MEPLKPDSILELCEAVTVLVFLILLYFTAVKKGIEQLKSLTILLIVMLVVATRLYFIGQVQICRLLPTTSAVDLDLFMGICLLAVWTAGKLLERQSQIFCAAICNMGSFLNDQPSDNSSKSQHVYPLDAASANRGKPHHPVN